MRKIGEFEKKIIEQGMEDEDFEEYAKLLKRVKGNFLKRQHCYITAVQMSSEFAEQAVKLIYYGLQNFEDGWFSTYTSYLYIGNIYEKIGNYQSAYDSYLLAKDALGEDHIGYLNELSKDLLWMRLHIDSFCYSRELEEHYSNYEKANEFSKAFVNNEFRITIASIVILLHYGKNDEAKQLFQSVIEMCNPNFTGRLHKKLMKHHYNESLKLTPEVNEFLKDVKDIFNVVP